MIHMPKTSAPRIAIPTPTTADMEYNSRSWPRYASSIEQTGGVPVRVALDLSTAALRELLQQIDGICLPGSPADVDPARYAAEVDPATSPADPQRERTDFALLQHAEDTGKPLLAICFGQQSMNVWRGGSLVQHLTPVPVNHAAGGQVAIAHTAQVAEDSTLGRLIAGSEATRAEAPLSGGFFRLPINTSHHQSVSQPGEGLRVSARCPDDGVVEAIEPSGAAVGDGTPAPLFLGVQWHPERSFEISATSRALFSRLVNDAAARAPEQA